MRVAGFDELVPLLRNLIERVTWLERRRGFPMGTATFGLASGVVATTRSVESEDILFQIPSGEYLTLKVPVSSPKTGSPVFSVVSQSQIPDEDTGAIYTLDDGRVFAWRDGRYSDVDQDGTPNSLSSLLDR